MKPITLPRDLYRDVLTFLLVELLALNLLAALFHLYESPTLGTSLLLILAFNCVIAVLFYRIRQLRQALFDKTLEQQRSQFIELELQNYRRHRHDMKNHLLVLYELARQGELEELQAYVTTYTETVLSPSLVSVDTGCEELDILIFSKIEAARRQGITFQFSGGIALDIGPRKTPTVISLFANLLDNALEAAGSVDEPENRQVILRLYEDPLDAVAVLTNTFSSAQLPDPRLLFNEGYSQKAPDRGRGLAIVRSIVGRLEGQMKIDLYEEHLFQVHLELPKHRLA